MDDLRRVYAWFAEGALVQPRAVGRADLVDLVQAISGICGVDGMDRGPQPRRLRSLIGEPEHVVFVLVDGLGSALLDDLSPRDGFLRTHVAENIEAICPSTTAAALTSLTTAEHPARHGILGWWTRLPDVGTTAEILPFIERFTKRPLDQLGATSQGILSTPSVFPRYTRDRLVVTRTYISESTYSRYWSGGSPSIGYDRIEEGIDATIAHVAATPAPSYTHLYLNQLDTICHQAGIRDPRVSETFTLIEEGLARLHAAVGGRARIIVTADHGHIDTGPDVELRHDDPLAAMLTCPPSGEPRAPLFHVLPGRAEAFATLFRDTFGDAMALVSAADVERLGLLGPGRLAPTTRTRLGDFLAIPAGTGTMHYADPAHPPHRNRGVHGGLTPAEMLVPLILA